MIKHKFDFVCLCEDCKSHDRMLRLQMAQEEKERKIKEFEKFYLSAQVGKKFA